MLDYDESTNPSNGWRAPEPQQYPEVHRARWPHWVFYGGRAWVAPDGVTPGWWVYLPWRVWPVVDLVDDNYGHGLIVRFGGPNLDAVIDDGDLVVEDEDDTMSCGCSEYHMADCPLVTDRYDGPPEPDEDRAALYADEDEQLASDKAQYESWLADHKDDPLTFDAMRRIENHYGLR